MAQLTPEQAAHWIGVLREQLNEQRKRPRLNAEKRLAFLSRQYQQLYLLARAIEGNVRFVGAIPIQENAAKMPIQTALELR